MCRSLPRDTWQAGNSLADSNIISLALPTKANYHWENPLDCKNTNQTYPNSEEAAMQDCNLCTLRLSLPPGTHTGACGRRRWDGARVTLVWIAPYRFCSWPWGPGHPAPCSKRPLCRKVYSVTVLTRCDVSQILGKCGISGMCHPRAWHLWH